MTDDRLTPDESRRQAGFTLIEAAIVLTLLGILLSIAGPSMGAFVSRTGVDRVLVQLSGDLAYARMLAVRSGQPVQLTTTADGTSYTVQQLGAAPAKYVNVAADYPGAQVTPALNLEFDSRGILRTGGTSFVAAERHGQRDSVEIFVTGRAYHVY